MAYPCRIAEPDPRFEENLVRSILRVLARLQHPTAEAVDGRCESFINLSPGFRAPRASLLREALKSFTTRHPLQLLRFGEGNCYKEKLRVCTRRCQAIFARALSERDPDSAR